MRLVAHVAKKYAYTDYDNEDLISVGTIGLIKAVMTFNPDKGSRLATYAARCIDNEILMMLRADKKRLRDVSLYDPVGIDKEGNEISLMEVVTDGPDVADMAIQNENMTKLFQIFYDTLSENERRVIILRYGLFQEREYTQREIAQMLGISRSYVSRIEKAALIRLRAKMESM